MIKTEDFHFQANAGTAGFLIGVIAMMIMVIHLWAGPFAPQQSAGVAIGELAAEIRLSATKALRGIGNPPPEVPERDIDQLLIAGATILAGLAVVLGLIGLIRREPGRPALFAVGLGVSAILFQLFVFTILLFAGVFLIIGVLQNMDGILGG
ncbi:hypothetical protein [Roseobacter ponti]|uniref:Uncharacterized protein n=1 Tax=Roseobacter ponti TaxID=1891787 RepID=A0A858SSK0_9RHOB|nr:hypothetical protein [Roseobacter ponti]QJF50957.1 hypothetical protein G3256_07190 [Roseobacter ponti]